MSRTVFDVAGLNARQRDLEQLAAQSDFWNDQQNARKQMRQLDDVKAQLLQLLMMLAPPLSSTTLNQTRRCCMRPMAACKRLNPP